MMGNHLPQADSGTVGRGALDVLAIETFTWTPHLEITCEVLLREIDAGRRVGFAFLDIDNIDELPGGTRLMSVALAVRRRNRLAKVRNIERIMAARGVQIIHVDPKSDQMSWSSEEAGIHSIESLRGFTFDGAALGFGILASLIRYSGDYDPRCADHRAVIDRLLNSAVRTFALSVGLIERHRPSEILVFNGRLASSKAVVEAAKRMGVTTLFHEVGGTYERFLVSSRPPQSTAFGRDYLWEKWENADPDRDVLAATYFSRGRGGAGTPERRHVGRQLPGHSLPRTHRRRVVYFVSSIDEYATVEDGVSYPIFDSQRCAVAWLVSWVHSQSDVELIIRIHPRMRSLSNREQRWWYCLAGGNVTVVSADSPLDSYALAASSDRVVCFHSSLGPESTYLGRVSILVGDADYRGLDCVYEPSTIQELEHMLSDTLLSPKPRENCLPFGYSRLTWGEPFRYYKPLSFGQGSFFGEQVAPFPEPRWTRLITGILRRLDRLVQHWRAKRGHSRR